MRIARVNSGHERVNCLVEKFLVQPAHDELRDAFLDAIRRRGTNGSRSTASLAPAVKSFVVKKPSGEPGMAMGRW